MMKQRWWMLPLACGLLGCPSKEPPGKPQTTAQPAAATKPAPQTIAQEPEPPFEDPCPSSGSCHREGRCTWVNDECQVQKLEDCLKSEECVSKGRCAFADGKCIATAETCAAWETCSTPGKCLLEGDACALDPQMCRGEKECSDLGLCSLVGTDCLAASDEDCRGSLACKHRGWCWVGGGPLSGRCMDQKTATKSKTGGFRAPSDPASRKAMIDRMRKAQ